MELFLLFAGSILVNNFVLTRFLGICPFLGVSKKVETSLSMGIAVIFVMTLSSVASWLIQNYILVPFGLDKFLTNVAFILVIASLVQLVEMVIQKTSPPLYQALGIFLPLITTNCAILGLALLIAINKYSLISSLVFGLGAGVGFTLAIVMMAGIREELQFADVPKPLQGAAITLITAGLMSMAFMGFSGLIPM
ncbi:Electron transport complex subunit RsxA [Koleobacter methoxysyntrophicus]|jgi:electron transport complex protein RnfA|uniref:Ion-translocating oxidoreductase complex subunit A n=1 Tax=Koleobacter methoxysyntrophicus TaxID=2751313 RepID=A0A8A0RNQ2_9FIRM|nr:electron transport complex subunit RsxA [Koleobacter methoxysyntrophicus]NPV43196.1 electron transport complex subunit RsxA [Bacillota bacterium]QSQ09522.1 Electron transport complex subunit RsxA [Koleobacter methoxysyntrophicus]